MQPVLESISLPVALLVLEVSHLNQSCHLMEVTDYCLHARFYQSFFERFQINPFAVVDG